MFCFVPLCVALLQPGCCSHFNVMTNLFSASNLLFQAIEYTFGCFEPRLRDRFPRQGVPYLLSVIYSLLSKYLDLLLRVGGEGENFLLNLVSLYIVCFSRSLCHIYMLIDIFITRYWSVCQRMGENQRHTSENSGGWSCTGSESYRIDRSNNSSGVDSFDAL